MPMATQTFCAPGLNSFGDVSNFIGGKAKGGTEKLAKQFGNGILFVSCIGKQANEKAISNRTNPKL